MLQGQISYRFTIGKSKRKREREKNFIKSISHTLDQVIFRPIVHSVIFKLYRVIFFKNLMAPEKIPEIIALPY